MNRNYDENAFLESSGIALLFIIIKFHIKFQDIWFYIHHRLGDLSNVSYSKKVNVLIDKC